MHQFNGKIWIMWVAKHTNAVQYLHFVFVFYPCDAMLARVFTTATCPSVCLDVRHMPVLCLAERKQDREMYTIWLPHDSSFWRVWFIEKFARGHPKGTCQMRVGWVFRQFSTNMSSYLENSAFYTQSYYGMVIGNHMQAMEWWHFRWPWVTLTRVSRSR